MAHTNPWASASGCRASGLGIGGSLCSSSSPQVPCGPRGLQMPPQSTAPAKVKGQGRSWRKWSAHGPPAGPPLPCRQILDRAHPRTEGVVAAFEHVHTDTRVHTPCVFICPQGD